VQANLILEAKMLQILLSEKMEHEKLSLRNAAKVTGVSHTTLARILNGDAIDLDTVVQVSKWLGLKVSSVLNSFGDDDIASSIAMIIQTEPKLGKVIIEAANNVRSGAITPDDLRDILAYLSYRINLFKKG
jgi:plasmid maintenance system antidote protein VapI